MTPSPRPLPEITTSHLWLAKCSFEVTPLAAQSVESFADLLAPKTRVFVTHLPEQPFLQTVHTVLRLRQEGMIGVAHIAARNLQNPQELEEGLALLSSPSNPSQFLLLGGSSPHQCGPFSSSTDLLNTGLFNTETHSLYFAGHPEGSPDIPQDQILKALEQKNIWAQDHPHVSCHLVTQFCFAFKPILTWIDLLSESGNQIPIHLGIPGIATVKTLYRHAKACGVGNSMRFLSQKMKQIALLTQKQAPDALLNDIALHTSSDPKISPITGFHLYPFGGLVKTLAWRDEFLKKSQTQNLAS